MDTTCKATKRPTGEEIFAAQRAHLPKHPRLIATETDFERVRRLAAADPWISAELERLIVDAREKMDAEDLPYAVDEGGRLANTKSLPHLIDWAFAWQMTGDRVFVERALRRLSQLADPAAFPNWHPAHYLNCAGIAQCVAIAYDWMYDAFTAEERAMIEEALYRNAVVTAIGSYNGTEEGMNQHGRFGRSTWTQTTNNWNAVCNSALTLTCLSLSDVDPYSADATWLMTRIMESIEIGTRCYAPDGSYEESPGYWSYGTNNLFIMCEALLSATGSCYGIMESEGLPTTCYFALYVESPDNGTWNYHDSGTGGLPRSHFFWVGRYFGDESLIRLQYDALREGKKKATLYDLLFYPEKVADKVTLPLDYCSKGIETAIFRSSFGSGALFTGLHGGYNSVNHGDLDAGSFILDKDGIRFFSDLGGDCYNMPGYFGKGKEGRSWRYYRKGAEGHNTIVIENDPEIPYGQEPTVKVPVRRFESGEATALAVLDMTKAYGTNCASGLRGMYISDNRSTVTIRDEISFREPRSLFWFAHTEGAIEILPGGRFAKITTEKKGKDGTSKTGTLFVKLISEDPTLRFAVLPAEGILPSCIPYEKEFPRAKFQKLAIHLKDRQEASITVVLSSDPEAEGISGSLAEWTI